MGMMVESLKHEGTSHSSSDLLKICVKMGASWSAQDFRQTGVTQSGPGAFFPFLLPEDLAHLILADLNCRCGGEGGSRRCEWCERLFGEVFRTGCKSCEWCERLFEEVFRAGCKRFEWCERLFEEVFRVGCKRCEWCERLFGEVFRAGCKRSEWSERLCGEAFGAGDGCSFKPAVKLVQIVCQLLIFHSAGGGCLVVGDLLQTFPH